MAAILAALQPTGEKLVRWKPIRDRLPGGFWAKCRALNLLWERWDIYAMKIHGVQYVALGDKKLAARCRAEGRVRDMLMIA